MKFVALRACVRPASLLAVLLGGLAIPAQQPSSPDSTGLAARQDPANLAGERVSAQALADTLPINHGAAALAQLLLKLRTRASLMLIVAHPDDEDGGMLTYESRGQGARVAMLTLNRGEGGQNLMSGDFDDALGLIRTQELLAADRYMGVDQFFGSVVDFGFSKTREESLEKWGHDRVLYDAVRAVRLYRPLVLTSVFVGGVTDGHGQHQVSGEISQEVFNAAADPKVFPEMGLPPWAPMKVYARAPFARIDGQGMFDYATGKYSPARFHNYVTDKWSDTAPPAAVIVHEGEVSTALGMDGMSYVQFARKGLALQKSQNGGASRGGGGGAFDSGYARYGSRIPNSPATEQTLFEGIDVTLPGIADLAPSAPDTLRSSLKVIDQQVAEAQRLFDPAKPELTAPSLRKVLGSFDDILRELENEAIDDLPSDQKFNLIHELRIKQVQANNALVLALGLTLEAHLTSGESHSGPAILLAGSRVASVAATLNNNGTLPIKFIDAGVSSPVGASSVLASHKGAKAGEELPPHAPAELTFRTTLKQGIPESRPYFSRPNVEQAYYDISDPGLRNAPESPSPLTAWATFDYQGVPVRLESIVQAKADTDKAERAESIPAVSVSLSPSAGILPLAKKAFTITARVTSYGSMTDLDHPVLNSNYPPAVPAEGTLHLEVPSGWRVEPASAHWKLTDLGEHANLSFTVTPAHLTAGDNLTIVAVAKLDGSDSAATYREGFRPVGYPGIPYRNYYTPASYKAAAADVQTAPGIRVAYLPGTGDDVPAYLPDLGITPTILTVADLTAAKLAQYDAVLLGVRAYAAHPELAGAGSQPLIEYAKNGGVVIVQYNTSRYGDGNAPFPISVPGSADFNVVEEADPVTVLAPDSPVLAWPNRITAADFNGWVAERGHGFARTWGPEFQPLLETHDPGQDPERGGLLVARTGKGYYIYTALALYRQLPEGVPGAYRLMANLISLGKNPGLKTGSTTPAK
jgi:LmbE family N-acetylglucosaminyl deacetylase